MTGNALHATISISHSERNATNVENRNLGVEAVDIHVEDVIPTVVVVSVEDVILTDVVETETEGETLEEIETVVIPTVAVETETEGETLEKTEVIEIQDEVAQIVIETINVRMSAIERLEESELDMHTIEVHNLSGRGDINEEIKTIEVKERDSRITLSRCTRSTGSG